MTCTFCTAEVTDGIALCAQCQRIGRIVATRVRQALTEAADAWQWGEWTAITAQVKAGGPAAVIGTAQIVTDWLRARVEQEATRPARSATGSLTARSPASDSASGASESTDP